MLKTFVLRYILVETIGKLKNPLKKSGFKKKYIYKDKIYILYFAKLTEPKLLNGNTLLSLSLTLSPNLTHIVPDALK